MYERSSCLANAIFLLAIVIIVAILATFPTLLFIGIIFLILLIGFMIYSK